MDVVATVSLSPYTDSITACLIRLLLGLPATCRDTEEKGEGSGFLGLSQVLSQELAVQDAAWSRCRRSLFVFSNASRFIL